LNIIFKCPECGRKLKASSALAGMDINCPACSGEIAIPFESEPEEDRKEKDEKPLK
jgi:DNA-directed RNA polymerase subunit RPC12/RpoP